MEINVLCHEAKLASNKFFSVDTTKKNEILRKIKLGIESNVDKIKESNEIDLENAKIAGIKGAFFDRLTLTDARIKTMCDGIEDIIKLPDYVGKVESKTILENGLELSRVHAPLGVVGIIYEARPNVTVDATALCIKSSNAVVLKGGKEAINTNRILVDIMKKVLIEEGIDHNFIAFIDSTDREDTAKMLKCGTDIDVVIPRGGEKLKKFVVATATMPVIASSGGNCHIFVEESANFDMANKIIENAKISRPSVCNALETLLVQRSIASSFLNNCLENLYNKGVEIRGTKEVQGFFGKTKVIEEDEFYTEYEDMIIKVKIVDDINQAISLINEYSTNHSDGIVTENKEHADKFGREIDSAVVYVNASNRFTDGFCFGLGAEMGISTQKLHVRGPIGLKELTSIKYVVRGNGQVRL
ncbi:MAG: glutamate-5-semialdehyde dehydrogenase [Clostridia bacterium]